MPGELVMSWPTFTNVGPSRSNAVATPPAAASTGLRGDRMSAESTVQTMTAATTTARSASLRPTGPIAAVALRSDLDAEVTGIDKVMALSRGAGRRGAAGSVPERADGTNG